MRDGLTLGDDPNDGVTDDVGVKVAVRDDVTVNVAVRDDDADSVDDSVTLTDRVAVSVVDTELEPDTVVVVDTDAVTVLVAVDDADLDCVVDDVTDVLAVNDRDAESVALGLPDGDRERDGVRDDVRVTDVETVSDLVLLIDDDSEGVRDADCVPLPENVLDGVLLGVGEGDVIDGDTVGELVNDKDGLHLQQASDNSHTRQEVGGSRGHCSHSCRGGQVIVR